jgi:TonB family protein
VLAGAILAGAIVFPLGFVLPAWDFDLVATGTPAVQPMPVPRVGGVIEVLTRSETVTTVLVPIVPVMWAGGAAVAVAMLVGGLVRVRSLAARAHAVVDERWTRMAAEAAAECGLRRPPVLLHSDGRALLATWGLFRPRVMLPADSLGWSDERIRLVLLHELAHVRRGDWAVQLGAEALGALYWFNPLMWIACAQLRRESERACDDVVLRRGVSPPVYARHLIDLARACRCPVPAVVAAMPMARKSALQERVTAMLNPVLHREGLSRRAAALTAIGLLAVTLPAAAFRAPQESKPLTGAVYDPSGAALPQVELTLEDAQHARMQVITDASGRFEFPPVPPGDYVLEASLPGFRRLHYELTLSRARDWNQAITLQVGQVREEISVRASRATPPTTAARPDTGGPLRVGGNIRPPKKIKDVFPQYPASMKEAGLEGVVPLEAVIGRDGSVTSVRVLSAKVHPDLAMAAVDAVRQWKFEPTLLNGVAVDVQMTVTINFRLSD